MKITAPRSGCPTRDRALLIAEPRPEFRAGIELISVLVSGATTIPIPTPNAMFAGRTSIRASTGGIRVMGRPSSASHGCVEAGMRASHSWPAATTSGPTTRKMRDPKRPVRPPTRAESDAIRIPDGRPMIAAPVAL